MFKRIIHIVATLMIMLILSAGVNGLFGLGKTYAVDASKSQVYVQGATDYLTDEDTAFLTGLGEKLEELTSAQLSLLLIDNLNGQDIESYANEAFQELQLGDSELENGVLFLFALENEQIKIEVGKGLKNRLTDARVEEILFEYATPYFKFGEDYKIIKKTYAALYNEIGAEYNIDKSDMAKIPGENKALSLTKVLLIVAFPVLALIDIIFFRGHFFFLLINTFTSLSSISKKKEEQKDYREGGPA